MSMKLYNENDINSIAEAINTKGVTGSFTVSEMADAVLEISGGGGVEPVTTIVLSSNKVKTTGDVTLTATLSTYRDYDVLEENGYLEGAEITFYKMLGATPNPATDTSLSTSITNNVGEATVDVTLTANSTIYARFDGIVGISSINSNTVTIEVINYLFYDACDSATGLSNYDSSVLLHKFETEIINPLRYDSTMNAYALSSNKAIGTFPILVLDGKTDIKISAEFYIPSTPIQQDKGFGLAVIGQNNCSYTVMQFQSYYGNSHVTFENKPSFQDGSISQSHFKNGEWCTMVLKISNGTDCTYEWYDSNEELYLTHTHTLTSNYGNGNRYGIVPPLYIEETYVRNIKVTSLE